MAALLRQMYSNWNVYGDMKSHFKGKKTKDVSRQKRIEITFYCEKKMIAGTLNLVKERIQEMTYSQFMLN